jgi:GNAT superfamily N-acetyltransferase
VSIVPARYRIEPLGAHDRTGFACGEPAPNRYFQRHASQDQTRGVAAIFVAIDTASNAIGGFYTLSAAVVLAASGSPELTRGLPRYPELPAILLGRMGVALEQQGRGLGRLLVGDAMRRCAAQETVGALFLVVDAKDDDLVDYYRALGFLSISDQPRRLCYPLSDLRRSLRRQR